MKKRIIFAFLFALIFAFPALAVPDLSEFETPEEAYSWGYHDRLIEEYNATANGRPTAERYMLYGIINRLYENNAFIEYSDDTIADAYNSGYSKASEHFAKVCAELEGKVESKTKPIEPKRAQDFYNKGYQAGYTKRQSEYDLEQSEKENNATIMFIICGIGCIFCFAIGYLVRAKSHKDTSKSSDTTSKIDYSSFKTTPTHSSFSQPKRASVDLFTPVSVSARNPATQPKRSSAVIHKKSTKEAFHSYISIKECEQLPLAQAHQLALDRYNQRNRSDWEVGLDFERFIGYQYEIRGYMVKYIGATSGKKDMGRDLIVSNGKNTYIVQCKRWSRSSQIYEKYIFQLYGTTELYKKQHPIGSVSAVFVTTSYFSAQAKAAASSLGIELIEHYPFYLHPIVKCKADTGQYYLPMDSDYDKISINFAAGDYYHKTVEAAISAGFHSAYQ